MSCHRYHTDRASLLCAGARDTDSDPACGMTWDSTHIYKASHLVCEEKKR